VYPKITGDVNVNNVLNIGDCSHGNEVEFNNPDFSEFKSRDGIISGNIQADFKRLVLEEHFDSIDGGRLRLLPCTDVPSLEKMTLTIDSPTGQKNIMIISKNLVKFGRVVCDPQTPMIVNDIITQIYSSDRTECKSNLRYISRYHSEMYLGENSITIKCKSNMEKGLLFDKRMVRYGEKANLKVGDSAEMKFNAKLLLQAKVFPHTHNSGNSGISYMNPFLDWKGSGEIACVKISRLNNAFHEEYLLLAKEAQIGNDETCAITIPGNEINNHHARIVRVSNRYWLASCGPTPVEYDDGDGFKDLMNRKAVPLRIGMKIRLHKDVSISVSEFKQVAVYK
jgi:hypothetical protein